MVTFPLRFSIPDRQPVCTLNVNHVTMFVKWPTFYFGKLWSGQGLCSTFTAQGYSDCWHLKLQSLGIWDKHGLWPLYLFSWCEATCQLHNNLTHPLWKHESHKEGAHKGGDVLVGQHSASLESEVKHKFSLCFCPKWKKYVMLNMYMHFLCGSTLMWQ